MQCFNWIESTRCSTRYVTFGVIWPVANQRSIIRTQISSADWRTLGNLSWTWLLRRVRFDFASGLAEAKPTLPPNAIFKSWPKPEAFQTSWEFGDPCFTIKGIRTSKTCFALSTSTWTHPTGCCSFPLSCVSVYLPTVLCHGSRVGCRVPQVTKSFFHGLGRRRNLDVVGPRWEVRPDTSDVYSKEFILGNPEVPSSGLFVAWPITLAGDVLFLHLWDEMTSRVSCFTRETRFIRNSKYI